MNKIIDQTLRRIVMRSVVVGMMFALFASPIRDVTYAAPAAPAASAPALGGTFLVGDSTSWRLFGTYEDPDTYDWWAGRHPNWHVDAVGGRNVVTLPARIDAYLDNVDSAPDMFVMALGTNPAPDGQTWWKWNYVSALNKLPSTTKVILVIPVRAGSNKGAKGDDVTRYAGYLHQIASERTNTIVANWRKIVLDDPTINTYTGVGEWTNDGIHQRRPFGREAWMDCLDRAVARF